MNTDCVDENYKLSIETISDIIIKPKKYTDDNKVAVVPLENRGVNAIMRKMQHNAERINKLLQIISISSVR